MGRSNPRDSPLVKTYTVCCRGAELNRSENTMQMAQKNDMWGKEQMDWFKNRLCESDATTPFKVSK